MFGKRLTLFRLLGFEVRADLSWLVLVFLITWSLAKGFFPFYYPDLSNTTYWWMGIIGALGLFISIVLHELSHSVVARRYGLPMKGITLFIFGGVAEMNDEPPSAKAEFLMAIAGPISSLIISSVFFILFYAGRPLAWPIAVSGVLQYLAWINAILAAFNLLPAFPLDGGRILRSILWSIKGNIQWATRIASEIGSGFGVAMIILGLLSVVTGNLIGGIWWFLIGMFLRNASTVSYRQLLIREALDGEKACDLLKPEVVAVSPSTPVDRLVEDFFYKYHYKMFPVVDNSKLVGCINAQNLNQVPRQEWGTHTAQEITRECSLENTIDPDTDAATILATMNRTRQSRLMVVDGNHLLGIVTLKDMLKYLSTKLDLNDEEELKAMEEEIEERGS